MEQRCFNQQGLGMLVSAKIKIKIPNLQNITRSLSKRELQTITFYRMVRNKEEGTCHFTEKCLDSSAPGKGVPLLLIPEYSGINKGQRVPDRSKTARKEASC